MQVISTSLHTGGRITQVCDTEIKCVIWQRERTFGRMNTNAKDRGGLQTGSVVRSVHLNVNMAMGYLSASLENCKVFFANKSI